MWIATSAVLALLTASLAGVVVVLLRRQPPAPIRETTAAPQSDDPASKILAAALDEVATAAVIVDADGRIVLRNRAAEPYGRGRHGEALVEASVQRGLQAARDGRDTSEDLRLHGPPERVVQVRGRRVLVDGEMVGAVALVNDLTDQRLLDAMRRDFVANVSHELKTPLGALSLLAETLEDETDPEVIERFSRRIRYETGRLAELVDDLLDLSRIEGGDREREPEPIGAVVREAVAAVGPISSNAGVEVTVREPDVKLDVLGDRSQLVTAMVNLLDNAVKYTAAGGHVTVEIRHSDDEVHVAVIDTGIGIPGRDLHRVFERFYRVDRGRSSETGGTGLGLSIVRHVAINHGGRVDVESTEGEGSRFTLVLPAAGASTEGELP